MLKGKLKITMVFEVPVSENLYPALQRNGVVTPEDILATEEDNYLNHVDDYLETVGDYVTEVSFNFEPAEERWDEIERGNRQD